MFGSTVASPHRHRERAPAPHRHCGLAHDQQRQRGRAGDLPPEDPALRRHDDGAAFVARGVRVLANTTAPGIQPTGWILWHLTSQRKAQWPFV